ncbi:hypothetical protein PRK78_002569 [Emydomyces testavorans]|uniref:Uncharacterized protein n=1 Tax=Emydomyces testavorans TaxID=2070801 RepID=A0AAF0DFB5_9EURO|nr:hypothetical protein PRK78_002569 [Emydomyces testavorans]
MARASASMIDERATGSLVSEFHSDSINFCRRPLSIPSFRNAPVDYPDLKPPLSDTSFQESIELPQSLPKTPSPVFKPIPLFAPATRTEFLNHRDKSYPPWKRFTSKHHDVITMRLLARERRVQLKYKRDAVTDLEAEFMKKLNQLLVGLRQDNPKLDAGLLGIFQQCQEARNAYYSLEDDYNELEQQLGVEEFELDEAGWNLKNAVDTNGIDVLLSPEEPPKTVSAEVYHPLVAQYLSRSGDVALLKEELWNLRSEHDMAQEDQNMKHKFGVSVKDPDLLDLLANFQQYEKEILDDLAVAQKEVQQLKSQCDEQGLLENNQKASQLRSNPLEAMDDIPDLAWSMKSPSFFEESLAKETFADDQISMTDFINKWLLHQLFQSPLDRLRSSSESNKTCSEIEISDLEIGCDKDHSAKAIPVIPLGIPASNRPMSAPTDMEKVRDTFSPENLDCRPQTSRLDAVKPVVTKASGLSAFHPSMPPPRDKTPNFDEKLADSMLTVEPHPDASDPPVDKLNGTGSLLESS